MPSTTSATKLAASFSFEAIGTAWQIDTDRPLSSSRKSELLAYCDSFDSFFSRFRSESAVRKLATRAGSISVPAEWVPLVKFYDELTRLTNGRFTACIGNSLSAAGYDETYSLVAKAIPETLDWTKTVKLDSDRLTALQPVLLDFGAGGKGFLVDCLTRCMQQWGVKRGSIDASGDVYTWGSHIELVGLEDPHDATRVLGVTRLQNQALCASASNRRSWGDGQHHIMDPYTKRSTQGITATWVRAETALLADGIATALFLVEPAQLHTIADFEYVRLHTDGSLDYSAAFNGQLFL